MNDKIMPLPCMRQWQFQKYKTAMIPILIILIGFILRLLRIEIPYIQYLMALSFVAYLAVLFVYRMGNPRIPEDDHILVSPVNGKIISVEQINGIVKIRINKSIFDPIELRCPIYMPEKPKDSDLMIPYGGNEIEMSFGDKDPLFFHEPGAVLGSLLGMVSGSYQVTLRFNENILNQALRIKKDDILVAGQTILAELKAPVALS
jgi:hypothetical protein